MRFPFIKKKKMVLMDLILQPWKTNARLASGFERDSPLRLSSWGVMRTWWTLGAHGNVYAEINIL